jgi:hypothetical protein
MHVQRLRRSASLGGAEQEKMGVALAIFMSVMYNLRTE